jgi:hypothetical protein
MELPLVATTAVRFARPDDALAHKVLEAIGRGAVADGVLGHNGRDGLDLPTLTVEAVRAQAYLNGAAATTSGVGSGIKPTCVRNCAMFQ